MITSISITIIGVIVMLAISALAYIKAPAGAKLPMQWGLDGTVNWRAHKIWAVLIFPITLTLCNGLLISLEAVFNVDDPMAETVIIGVAGFQAALMLVLHIGYLYFALRDVRRN